jgi:FKBP-type peptidyl-prolyl cis-trans isomerase
VLVVRYQAWSEDWRPLGDDLSGPPLGIRLGAGEVCPGLEDGLATLHHGGRRRLEIQPGAARGGPAPASRGLVRYEVQLLGEDWSESDPALDPWREDYERLLSDAGLPLDLIAFHTGRVWRAEGGDVVLTRP